MPARDVPVVVVGGGVVGCAVAFMLARRGVDGVLLEAAPELALGASGTNSGILHTGFDSVPGELETRLILRAAQLRDPILDALGVPVLRCGAAMAGAGPQQLEIARANGVPVTMVGGELRIPGEAVTDPAAYTSALARASGWELRTGARVGAIGSGLVVETEGGDRLSARVVVNCAGLYADEVALLAGDHSFEIYPRKGEFFVFDAQLDRILLPLPTKRTKGVLVFPTIDGKVVAGPTARDLRDKRDWSVRPEAWDEVMPKAVAMFPPLEGLEPVAAYAGLRPAGRGVNYWIEPSLSCPGLINVAAIRSTGLTASLAIGEYVAGLVADQGVPLGPYTPVAARGQTADGQSPWWRRRLELA